MLHALEGGYILPEAGGDLLRDGTGVLPTGEEWMTGKGREGRVGVRVGVRWGGNFCEVCDEPWAIITVGEL